ncbi:pentapeptide repeat-containing protein [Rhizobium sp. 9T]|uniref:pentapeptide repeat-containing protein n=1 Tax=Rhizobium croatiense TaxID=2867516 RepID=UPI001C9331EB|nr:pentapeptide repeat-containing protein [Rhizobium croatiense]MBY4611382.1 pentapeptide repeat-containing protein [Rhizobium croatiense]
MTQQEFVSAIEAGRASGQGASFSDIEFSPDERLRSKKKYATQIVPFSLNVKNKTWRGIHFKNCSVTGLAFTGAVLEDCTFENCQLAIQNWESRYSNCKFISCDMRSFSFGADQASNANAFQDVVFEKCSMQTSGLDFTVFERASFLNCKLDRAEFRQATILQSKFVGKLDDVVFGRDYTNKPSRLQGVDFSKATINYSIFPNTHVSDVTAPESPKIHAISRYKDFIADLDRAIQADPGLGDVALAGIFTSEYTANSNFGIINEDDFRELLKPKGMERLAQMLADPRWKN